MLTQAPYDPAPSACLAAEGGLAMTSSVMTPDSASARPGRPSRIFALMPLWVLVIVAAFSSDFLRALDARPPDVLGIPLATVVDIAALAWMAVGLAVIWNAASRVVESIALTIFTIPATVVVVAAPVAIEVLQNFG